MSATQNTSIVEYMSHHGGYSCGYCKSQDTNHSHGMWAHILTVADYQDLIDRGWRRSGKYCYKPAMNLTCCPQYTIKCDASQFKISKSQKNVLKKLNKYLSTGEIKQDKGLQTSSNEPGVSDIQTQSKLAEGNLRFTGFTPLTEPEHQETVEFTQWKSNETQETSKIAKTEPKDNLNESKDEKLPKPGLGADPSKPPRKKAKLLRLERRQQKNSQNPSALKQTTNCAKTIEDYLNAPLENAAHKLEILLVRSHPKSNEFKRTLKQSHEVYSKYQQTVHNDEPRKCSLDQYLRFLVNSPLEIKLVTVAKSPSKEYENSRNESFSLYQKYQIQIHNESLDECDKGTFTDFLQSSPLKPQNSYNEPKYGSFHQQYWLDGKLIAVGVIDVLPRCVSSVYFYYDPDYRFLSLGTYASLQEIAFTRELSTRDPNLKYYYMGFYIHSCPKMRYKGQYNPSFLLCPEVYSWHSIEDSRTKLDRSKYSRLNDDTNKIDENTIDVNFVSVFYRHVVMPYSVYRMRQNSEDEDEVVEYAQLVGGTCARRIVLFRS